MIIKSRENKLPPTNLPRKFTPSFITLLNFNEIGCKQCNENDQMASVFCYFQILFSRVKSARWKTRGRGPGVRGAGSRGTGSRGVENAGCEKRGAWKTRGVENAESGGKHGVWWKTRGLSEKHGGNRIFLAKLRHLNFAILNCNEN